MTWFKKPTPLPLKEFCAKANEYNPCPEYFIDDHIAICEAVYQTIPFPTLRHAEVLGRAFSPLINLLNDRSLIHASVPPLVFEAMVHPILTSRLFPNLMRKLDANVDAVGKLPTEHTDLYPFVKGTPFELLADITVPLYIAPKLFLEHTHIVGGTGAGKTQFLSQLILHFLAENCSLVVVDSQNSLIPKLLTLEAIQKRIVHIDPRNPPTINVFKKGAAETFDYLFDSLVGADLTGKQSVFFDMLTRLMLSLPNATLRDMIEITADTAPYRDAIQKLPDIPRTFFERDFPAQTFKQTREQVRYRLNALLADEKFERLFGDGSVDFRLDKRSVVLIDTDRDYLGRNSGAFGRLFIFLLLQELFARNPNKQNTPVYLIMDEAHEYLDRNVDALLTQARKYGCGVVLAHQTLSQASPDLRASLASNTSIKLAGGVSSADAKALAGDMRTTADFILAQKPLSFACYVRTVTDHAVSVQVTAGLLDDLPHVSRAPPEPKPEPKRDIPQPIDDHASDTW